VRALEDAALRAAEAGVAQLVLSGKAEARLFVKPGFQFRAVEGLLTELSSAAFDAACAGLGLRRTRECSLCLQNMPSRRAIASTVTEIACWFVRAWEGATADSM